MQAFNSYMVLFESGAGGHIGGGIEAASAMIAAHGGGGWVLGCRRIASEPGLGGRSLRKIVEVTLICAFGDPAPEAVVPALEAAARRHAVEYRLVVRRSAPAH